MTEPPKDGKKKKKKESPLPATWPAFAYSFRDDIKQHWPCVSMVCLVVLVAYVAYMVDDPAFRRFAAIAEILFVASICLYGLITFCAKKGPLEANFTIDRMNFIEVDRFLRRAFDSHHKDYIARWHDLDTVKLPEEVNAPKGGSLSDGLRFVLEVAGKDPALLKPPPRVELFTKDRGSNETMETATLTFTHEGGDKFGISVFIGYGMPASDRKPLLDRVDGALTQAGAKKIK